MKRKYIAYTLGMSCHLLFAGAISLMGYMLFNGLTESFIPLGSQGRYYNILLLLQFPLFHSFLLTERGKRLLQMPFPKEIAKDLTSTMFSLVSSLQLLVVFLFWTPNSSVWFAPHGGLLWFCSTLYLFSWIMLIIALSEAGMALHTGALGWRAVASRKKPVYPSLSTEGLHGLCRHPIYLAFSLIILTAPTWSLDHFLLAVFWILYCIIGPQFKEKRIERIFGERYQSIKNNIPYIIPRFSRSLFRKH